jgi:hypothetical protein
MHGTERARSSPLFVPSIMRVDGRPVRAFRIVCGGKDCAHTAETRMNSLANDSDRGVQENRLATRRFANMGWEVGLTPARHRCPSCIEKRKQEVKPMSVVTPIKPPEKAEPPKPMGREDRRVIFEKLNDVYLDEKRGYSAPWTDKKVGEDLGVPRAWVTQVREEMFGPEASNEEIQKTLAAATAVSAEIKVLLARADELKKLGEDIDKRLAAVHGALR